MVVRKWSINVRFRTFLLAVYQM